MARGYEPDDWLKLRIDDEFSYILDIGRHEQRGEVSPWLGLRHEGAQAMLADLIEMPLKDNQATAGTNLGYILGGEFRIWHVSTEPGDLLAKIQEGEEVLGQYRSLERLPEVFEIRGAKSPLYYRPLICVYLLLGDEAHVREWLAEGERLDCRHDNSISERFHRFEANVEAKLAELKAQ